MESKWEKNDRLKAAIKKANSSFTRLSASRKRVRIAKDVLKQIDSRRFVPWFGIYLHLPAKSEAAFNRFYEEYRYRIPRTSPKTSAAGRVGVRETVADTTCKVCGIGSLFVAMVDRVNACTIQDMGGEPNNGDFMVEYLSQFFSEEQLVLIETAFEGRMVSSRDTDLSSYNTKVKAAIRFTRRLKSPAGRLKKIMNNIVLNNGTFVP